MSASRTGMYHYDPKRKALHSIKTEATQINQYGYYEMRAKMQAGGGVHCAWWLIGFEDDPNQSCEIDIFEILGTDVNRIWSTVHSWKDSTIQYHTEHPWFANKKLAEEFHVYGFDWTPEGVTVYVDGIRVMTHKAAITYPLVQIISFMTIGKRKRLDRDLRSFRPVSEEFRYRLYPHVQEDTRRLSGSTGNELRITSIEPARLQVSEGKATLRDIDGHVTRELLYTPSFVNVHYNDGTVTQQFVEWEPLDDKALRLVQDAGTVIVNGKITGLPDGLLKGQEATLIITTTKND